MITEQLPGPQDAVKIVQDVLGIEVACITRFTTGAAHFVYDVQTVDGQALVVRLTRPGQRTMFAGAVYWHHHLVPLGVPLPRFLYVDLREAGGFPVIVMERLPGADLGTVYPNLTLGEKQALAHEMVRLQHAIGALPLGHGFGYAVSHTDPGLHRSWAAVVEAHLDRSRERMAAVGVVDEALVERVRTWLHRFEPELAAVEPRCFLDDTTTKNVIIHAGRLSGIVDVDMVCFGDPLYTLALTRMALLSCKWDTAYTDAWAAELELTPAQQQLLHLYTAVFCLDFLAEQGQQFNRATVPAVDMDEVRHLTALLDTLVARI